MEGIKIFHIASYAANRPNGIKSVLEQIIPIQKRKIEVELLNLKEEKIKKIENKNLVIFHGVYNLKYIFLYKELIKNKIPYIIVPHCSITMMSLNQSKLKKKIFNCFAKKFYKNATAVGFLNEEEKKSSIEIN
ncbi:hypothetical protein, partial [Cetobacterium sp.]|uniref:hypothetical protein n=1 Tax=Cetobacterium sp. TaxID=2071632 RepID=UPI003EE52E41